MVKRGVLPARSAAMTLNESIVEDAALEWFGELVPQARELEHGPHLAPGEPASRDGGRDSFGKVVMMGRLREAIRRLNPAIPPRTLATLRDPAVAGLPRLLSGELSVAAASATMEASV